MTNNCDCFVGILNDYSNDWRLYVSENVYDQCRLYKGDVEPKKLVNSGHCTKFKYCPRCGEKIDWEKLLTAL